jgi:16S rRNA (uracil1498-N3)-methyltransferase
MRLHRFYIKEDSVGEVELVLREDTILHQMRDVFRLGSGDRVILFNRQGFDYIYVAELISKREARFKLLEKTPNIIPSKKVTLYMSLIKKDNFEMVLEKCTELGVTHFVPVITERTQSKNLNMERAEKIMKEASEQCGRGDIPTLNETISLEKVLDISPDVIAFDMTGGNFQITNHKLQTELLIGPEGGWSEKELNLFKEKKIQTFKLGETVLRAETAAIVASVYLIKV